MGLPLTILNVWENPNLADVSPVRGKKLILFQAGDTAVEDLTPFEKMPLGTVGREQLSVRDHAGYHDVALNHLRCDGCPIVSSNRSIGSTVRELHLHA